MITLKDWKSNLTPFPFELPPFDKLVLSAIGARICYSDEHPLDLIRDPRVSDPKQRALFLTRLAKAGHFSVFAHSPVFFTLDRQYVFEHKYHHFKLWRYVTEKDIFFCATARHFLEDYHTSNADREAYISSAVKLYLDRDHIVVWMDDSLKPVVFEDLDNAISNSLSVQRTKGILAIIYRVEPWYWCSFIAHGFSVIYSHQHVRHTWQNFNQRSHRYTKVDDIVVPPSIVKRPDIKEVFDKTVDDAIKLYDNMIEQGIPKEDARFIVPSGRATTLMFSGPYFVMEDFIQKRRVKSAQWEIRQVTLMCERILDFVLKD